MEQRPLVEEPLLNDRKRILVYVIEFSSSVKIWYRRVLDEILLDREREIIDVFG